MDPLEELMKEKMRGRGLSGHEVYEEKLGTQQPVMKRPGWRQKIARD